jgi:hypothetical protein
VDLFKIAEILTSFFSPAHLRIFKPSISHIRERKILLVDFNMTIPKIERPKDQDKINIGNPYEVNWWCIEFGVARTHLIEAVSKAGVSAAAVRLYLLKKSSGE